MLAVKKIVQFVTLLLVGSAFCLSGCGGTGTEGTGETIYLHVLNAYPGASKLTLYGPTGKIASGLPYGQRSEEAVEVDRNTDSTSFLLVLDGAPSEIQFNKQLFSLYPQETATMIITRRSAEEAAEVSLFRNTRTFSPTCVMSFANSLSLNNDFMPSELISYSYQTEWELKNQQYYVAESEEVANTRCGPTAIRPTEKSLRDELIGTVNDDPWFFPVQGEDGYVMRWGVRETDPRTGEPLSQGLKLGGQVSAMRDSEEFVECMSAAVTVVQEEDSGGSGGSSSEQECPVPSDGALLGADQVVWDEVAVLDCLLPVDYAGFPVEPGQEGNTVSFEQDPRDEDGENVCGHNIRVRTPTQDLIFQNGDNGVPNYIDGTGGFVQIDANYKIAEHRYLVLFGRPVNPFVEQWSTVDDSVSTSANEIPYPGDAIPNYSR